MRCAVLWCAGILWSCAPAGEAPGVAELRQALPGVPEQIGFFGSRLGASLASCPGMGFVAGAPGTGTAWLSTNGVIPAGQGNNLGRAVICRDAFNPQMVAAGQAGLRREDAGSWNSYVTSEAAYALSLGHSAGLPILVGLLGKVVLVDGTTQMTRSTQAPGGTFGSVAVQWFPSSARFAVTQFLGGQVGIYDFDPNQNTLTIVGSIANTSQGFGKSLAVGDFFPMAGEEIAIGANGVVHIYNLGGSSAVALSQFPGTDLSFGSSLAVERDVARGVDMLLVGEPGTNTVYRFLGNARSVVTSLNSPGAQFGASIAVDATMTQLAVGAPEYQSRGAVFIEPLGLNMRVGEAGPCVAGQSCVTSDCMQGTCIGDVFCSTAAATDFCSPSDVCNGSGQCIQPDGGLFDAGVSFPIDAGTPGEFDAGRADSDGGALDASVVNPIDGGVRDGGSTSRDAGPITSDAGIEPQDAGTRKDAGLEDAGLEAGKLEPLIFSTTGCSGCSEAGALPLVLLGLAWARRRRGSSPGHFPLRGRGMA